MESLYLHRTVVNTQGHSIGKAVYSSVFDVYTCAAKVFLLLLAINPLFLAICTADILHPTLQPLCLCFHSLSLPLHLISTLQFANSGCMQKHTCHLPSWTPMPTMQDSLSCNEALPSQWKVDLIKALEDLLCCWKDKVKAKVPVFKITAVQLPGIISSQLRDTVEKKSFKFHMCVSLDILLGVALQHDFKWYFLDHCHN